MSIDRALGGSLAGMLCGLLLTSCGGMGYGGGSAPMITPASVTLSVSPTTITLGETVTVTWSSNAGTSCTATGDWTGAQMSSGSQSVTPTTSGTASFTLACAGGNFANGTATTKLTVNAASAYSLTLLDADTSSPGAAHTDPNLLNAWGLSIAAPPFTNPAWIADNGSETSTLYNGSGTVLPLVVSLPAGTGGVSFDPTGIVFNPSATDFVVNNGSTTGSALFVFDGEGGMIAGWSPTVDATHGVTMYADTGGAVYKGLAIASNGAAWYLYATDFHNGKVDVFNTTFTKQATSSSAFTFSDPSIPAGYAPFGIQAINSGANAATQIFVTYAKQMGPDNHDEVDGAGLGFVDVYDTNGQLIKQVAAGGWLNAPWGLAWAPSDFGTLSNALLVGNFGDGKINAYDGTTWEHRGYVTDSTGAPITVDGLWGIAFGNDAQNQPHNTLFVAAGPNNEADGSYDRIDLGASAPTLGAPPLVTLTAPSSPLTGTVQLSATVTDTLSIAKVEFWANSTPIGTATSSPYTVTWDTTTWANGTVTLTAHAWDVNGNVGASAATTATVHN